MSTSVRSWKQGVSRRFGELSFVSGMLALALACGGGSGESGSSEGSESSEGGEAEVDLSPEALLATYERNGRFLTRGGWAAPAGPLAEHADAAMSALRTWATNENHPESYLTLEVISPDWSLLRHDISGEVTGRSLAGVVIARFPDGGCLQYAGSFVQEYVGGDFVETITARGIGGGVGVPCEMAEVVAQREGVAQ